MPGGSTEPAQWEEAGSTKREGKLSKLLQLFKKKHKEPATRDLELPTVEENLPELEPEPALETGPAAEPEPWLSEEVYYVTGEGRRGPIPVSELYRMVSDGELGVDTPVSIKGTSEWLVFPEYLQAKQSERAQRLLKGKKSKDGSGMPWGVALAPLWGGILPVVATQIWVSLGHPPMTCQAQLWWVVVAIMTAACYLDLRTLKKSGHRFEVIDLILCLLVPVYLCRRQRSAWTLLATLMVWGASCMVALAFFVLVNGYNAPLLTIVERMIHVQPHLH